MYVLRKSKDRGKADHGWLQANHTFSFADYFDPRQMGFGALRVINDDTIQPGGGFNTHPHRDMEILSYMINGAMAHKDSLGNGAVIRVDDIQWMTAGSGVQHSEFNPSKSEVTRLLQIWIKPRENGLPPSYGQKTFPKEQQEKPLQLLASADGREGSVTLQQEVAIYRGLMKEDEKLTFLIASDRQVWVQMVDGKLVTASGDNLKAGDGLAVTDEHELTLKASVSAEFLLFDLIVGT